MLGKDENFHSTCPDCGKLIPNQHFDCQRKMIEAEKKKWREAIEKILKTNKKLQKLKTNLSNNNIEL